MTCKCNSHCWYIGNAGGILNGLSDQFVAKMKGATAIKFWLGWLRLGGSDTQPGEAGNEY
jgi:hypothetical protein